MDNLPLKNYKTRLTKYCIWVMSSILALGSSLMPMTHASAKMKKQIRSMRSQIKIMRINAEISGKDFIPTMEMVKIAPDVVKSEMQKFETFSKELKEMQSRVKSAQYKVKLFTSLHKKEAASIGELRRKIHTYNALKARALEIRTKALSELETELVKDAAENNKGDMALKIQLARISAEINDKPFKPTQAMIDDAPDLVEAQTNIFNTHIEHLNVIDARIAIAKEEIKLSKSAFEQGYISKTEYIQILHSHNKLVNANLKLHCKILTKSEQIKIETSSSEKIIMG